MKKKKILLALTFLITVLLLPHAMAEEEKVTIEGGIDSSIRGKLSSTRAGNNVIAVFAMNFRGEGKKNIDIKLDYDKDYFKLAIIAGVYGEPGASCKIFDQNTISCVDLNPESEATINVVFKLKKDLDKEMPITATATMQGATNHFSKPNTKINVKPVKETLNPKTAIQLMQESITLEVGKAYSIEYSLAPELKGEEVTFSSTNARVASVSDKGVVKANEAGSSDIVIKVGNITKNMAVRVVADKAGINAPDNKKCALEKINIQSSVNVNLGEVAQLQYSLEPACVLVSDLKFEVANSNIAWVDSNGYVIGLNPGKTELKISGGDKYVNVLINVVGKKAKNYPHPLIVVIITLVVEAIIFFVVRTLLKAKNITKNKKDDDKKDSDKDDSNNKDESDDEFETLGDDYFDGLDLDV